MIDIQKIQKEIAWLYASADDAQIDVPLAVQANQLVSFAKQYITAASIVDKEAPQLILPIIQLTGHAVELSLKACLASKNVDPRKEHKLTNLFRKAQELGFELSESEFAAIVRLQHFYYRDLKTGTDYKARYPTIRDEPLGGSLPPNSTFTSIVNSLIKQATQGQR